ncbi:HEAT repeat domain-containing protein [Planctomycetota bacterium]
MTKSRKPEMEWYSPQALANRADDGFRFVGRSAVRIVSSLPSGVGYGVSKVGRVFIRRKQKMVKQKTEPEEAAPPQQDVSLKTVAGLQEREVPPRDAAGTVELAQCDSLRATVEEPRPGEETGSKGPPLPPLDVDALLKGHAPQDRVKAITLRKALDDLLNGSNGARRSALETLVDQGQAAGPLLAACSRGDSSQVVETALEGLRQIDWPCLFNSISRVLESSDSELRIIALRAAGRMTDKRKRPLLERGLRDASARVRRRSLSYLSWDDSSWAIAEIMRLCDDQQPDVRWAAVEALMTLRPSEAYNHLELMMPSLDPVHKRRAAALLAERKVSTNSKARNPEEREVQGPPASKAPGKTEQTAGEEKDALQSAEVESPQGRKRKRKEPRKKKASNAVKT